MKPVVIVKKTGKQATKLPGLISLPLTITTKCKRCNFDISRDLMKFSLKDPAVNGGYTKTGILCDRCQICTYVYVNLSVRLNILNTPIQERKTRVLRTD